MATKAEELRIMAQEIKNETQVGANTADRVGTAFEQAANGLAELSQNVGGVYEKIKSIEDAGYVFAGIATPTTNPGTPDGPVFYFTTTAGIYTRFSGIEVAEGEVVILQWNDGAWTKKTTGFATQDKLTKLENVLGYKPSKAPILSAGEVFFSGRDYTQNPSVNKFDATGGYGHGYDKASGNVITDDTLVVNSDANIKVLSDATINNNSYWTGYEIPFAYPNCRIRIIHDLSLATMVFAFKLNDGSYIAYNNRYGTITNIEVTTPSNIQSILFNTSVNTFAILSVNEYGGEDESNYIGNLSNLTTKSKNNLVDAINEIKSLADTNRLKITSTNNELRMTLNEKFYIKTCVDVKYNTNIPSENQHVGSICGIDIFIKNASPNGQIISTTTDEYKDGCVAGKKYPIPILRSGFVIGDKEWIPSEKENRLVGDILFGIYAKGDLNANTTYRASFDGVTFKITDGNNDIVSINCSSMVYASELGDKIKDICENSDTFVYLEHYSPFVKIEDVLTFSNIDMIEDYGTYKSYPLFFRNSICTRLRTIEAIGVDENVYISVDGKLIANGIKKSGNELILVNNNKIAHHHIDITNGELGDAELLSDRILSPYSPIVKVSANHVLLKAHEYNSSENLKTSYDNGDIEPTPSGNSFQPISLGLLRRLLWTGVKNGWKFISLRTYSDFLNGKIDKLPKKCFVFIFDDQEFYIPAYQEYRSLFDQYGAVGSLCWQIWSGSKDDYIKNPLVGIQARLDGWGFVLHDEGIIDSNLLQAYLGNNGKFNKVMRSLYIDTSIMVGSGHATSPSGREEMEYLGYCTFVAGSGGQGKYINKYHLQRTYVNDGVEPSSIVE